MHLILHEGRFKNTLFACRSGRQLVSHSVCQSASQSVSQGKPFGFSLERTPSIDIGCGLAWPVLGWAGHLESDVRRGAKWLTGRLLYRSILRSTPMAGHIIKSDVCLAFVALESCVCGVCVCVCCDYKTLMSASTLPNE